MPEPQQAPPAPRRQPNGSGPARTWGHSPAGLARPGPLQRRLRLPLPLPGSCFPVLTGQRSVPCPRHSRAQVLPGPRPVSPASWPPAFRQEAVCPGRTCCFAQAPRSPAPVSRQPRQQEDPSRRRLRAAPGAQSRSGLHPTRGRAWWRRRAPAPETVGCCGQSPVASPAPRPWDPAVLPVEETRSTTARLPTRASRDPPAPAAQGSPAGLCSAAQSSRTWQPLAGVTRAAFLLPSLSLASPCAGRLAAACTTPGHCPWLLASPGTTAPRPLLGGCLGLPPWGGPSRRPAGATSPDPGVHRAAPDSVTPNPCRARQLGGVSSPERRSGHWALTPQHWLSLEVPAKG